MARSRGGFIGRMSIFGEIWPIVLTMVLLSVLIVLTEGSAVAPFIYALF